MIEEDIKQIQTEIRNTNTVLKALLDGIIEIKEATIPKKEPNDSEKESNEEFDEKMIGDEPRAFCKSCDGLGCDKCKYTGLNKKARERLEKKKKSNLEKIKEIVECENCSVESKVEQVKNITNENEVQDKEVV